MKRKVTVIENGQTVEKYEDCGPGRARAGHDDQLKAGRVVILAGAQSLSARTEEEDAEWRSRP